MLCKLFNSRNPTISSYYFGKYRGSIQISRDDEVESVPAIFRLKRVEYNTTIVSHLRVIWPQEIRGLTYCNLLFKKIMKSAVNVLTLSGGKRIFRKTFLSNANNSSRSVIKPHAYYIAASRK